MHKQPLFIYSTDFLTYHFSTEHPFNQKRLLMTKELLEELGYLPPEQIISPRLATDEELALIHTPDYIQAVKALSQVQGERSEELAILSNTYGLNTEDTPSFTNMHEATARIAGGSLLGAELIMQGQANYVLNLAGGLHHAFRSKASGFCIYNDCSVAIAHLAQKYQLNVLYIDTDAHHGDGVQFSFYDDPRVFTLSIHETGRYLFPGTGGITERGDGQGYGFTLNLPVDAFTEDESWLATFQEGLELAAEFFKPDIIVSQNGCDAHFYDPLTHLSCSMQIYAEIPKLVKQVADHYCQSRWLALGGGGYDIYRVVPRAWSLLWMVMNNHSTEQQRLPEGWRAKWSQEADVPLPTHFFDLQESIPIIPRKLEIEEKNRLVLQKATYNLRRQVEINRSKE